MDLRNTPLTKLAGRLRSSWRLQLILTVAAVQAVLVVALVWDFTRRQASMLLERETNDAQATVETMAVSVAGLAANEMKAPQGIVDAQRRDPNVEFAMVLDLQGRVLAHTDRTKNGWFVHDLPKVSRVTVLSRTTSLVDVVCPVVLAGRPVGWARVGMSQRHAQTEVGRIRRRGLTYGLMAVVLGTVIATFLGTRLTSRVYAIRAVSRAIRSGNRAARVRPLGRDEVGQLAEDFNHMLDGLNQKEREIEQLNAELEQRVNARTKELEEAVELNGKLVETTTLGIVVFESTGRCVLANEAASRAIGGTIQQLLAKDFRQIASWAKAGLRDRAEAVLSSGVPQRVETGVLTSFQRDLIVDCSLSRFEARGRPHLLVTFADITDRKRTEAALQQSLAQLKATLESTADGILVVNSAGRVTGYNKRFVEFGRIPETMLKSDDDAPILTHVVQQTKDPEAFRARVQAIYADSGSDSLDLLEMKDGRLYERYSHPQVVDGRPVGRVWSFRNVTEQKRVERELTQSNQRLKMLWQSVENSPASILITDIHGEIEYVNPKFIEATGYSREEVLGRNPRLLKSGQTPDAVYSEMWATLKAGLNWHGELCNRRKDGSWFWESTIISPVKDEQGNIVSYLAIKEDITTKKMAEQEAAEGAARLLAQKEIVARLAVSPALVEGHVDQVARELTEAVGRGLGIARVGVWLFNEEATRLRCVDLFEPGPGVHSAGVELNEADFRNEFDALKQSKYIDAHDPLTDPRTAGYVEGYLKPLGITSMLDAVVRAGGHALGVVCLEHVRRPHHWQPDEIAFTCQIADQVSLTLVNRERWRAERELQRSVSLLQATLQSTADGILVVDQGGRITSFNQRFAELSRIPAEILDARDDKAAVNHVLQQLKDPDAFVARVDELYRTPERESFDVIELHDGRVFERHSRPQLVNGRAVGRVWSFRDVTERRRLESEQRKLVEELRRSNTDLEQFAYVASHDLKSPLRAINDLASWLQEDLEAVLTGESGKHLNLLRQRAQRMERLLDDLLAYSRAGRLQADIVPVDVARLVKDIADLVHLPAGFSIRLNGAAPIFATAATPLRTVLTNLISNSVKHHDRPDGLIEVSVREDGPWHEFSVADDGPGIPPEFHQRIWGMFQTLRPRDEVEGSGIGLALVQRIVSHYGGHALVECRAPRGSVFRFTWPKSLPPQ